MATYKMSNAISENVYMAKSRRLVSPDDDTYYLINVPKYAFVEAVWLNVVTAAVAGPPVASVGWAGNGETAVTNGFITDEVAKVTVAGLKRAQDDTLTTHSGKYFNAASGIITFTFEYNSATTVGVYEVFVKYSIIT